MTYRDMLRRHGGTIAFGFCFAFLSAFGQTFFISLFGSELRAAFGLSHGGFGLIYSTATLASGLLMIWAGAVIDRISAPAYGLTALCGLGLAALGLTLAPNVAALGLALFFLRLFGQGMLGHAAVTSTARLPQGIRGRAVGIAILGFSSGEILLPTAVILFAGAFGWLAAWRAAAALLLAGALLLAALLVRERRAAGEGGAVPARPSVPFRRRDLLTDWRFLILIPTMVAPPAINTGFFFHQRHIAEAQGWTIGLMAMSVSVYAAAGIVSTMSTGFLVDRFGATRLCRFHLLPLGAASLVLAGAGAPAEAPVMFALMGLTAAANGVIIPAALAEIYGTERLGGIRALAGAIMVWGSAATPVLFGLLFDARVPLAAVGIGSALYVAGASLAVVPLRRGLARLQPDRAAAG